MTDLIIESALIVAISSISLWIVLFLAQLPRKARVATAVVIVLWALFWGIRMTSHIQSELESKPSYPGVAAPRR